MGHRLLLAGVGPLPDSRAERIYAPALRLWAMMQTLLHAGHHVLVADADFGHAAAAPPPEPAQNTTSAPEITRLDIRLQHARVPLDLDGAARTLRSLAETFRPEAVVTTTDVMALAAVRAALPQPLYVDYNGDPMAERQVQGAVHGNDDALCDAWTYMLPVLLRADRFAACSRAQRFAMLGQLAAAGRLNRHTCHHDLVDVLCPGLAFEKILEPSGTFQLRGNIVPPDAVVVLFTGGYNTWLDEVTLFGALEEAMTRNPAIHYVSTGGGIEGHNTLTFERFKSKIDSSRHKSRYHFLGWVPAYQLADVCEQAHIAINLDRFTAEAELGFRNRLILWMWNGVAVVSTALCDQLRFFEQRRLIRAVPVGDPHAVADAILELAKSDETRQLLTERARAFLADEYGFLRLLEPLARWAASPSLAPDRLESLGDAVRSAKDPTTPPPAIPEVQNPLAQAQRQFLEIESLLKEERRARQEAEAKLRTLEGSRFVKLYKSLFKK